MTEELVAYSYTPSNEVVKPYRQNYMVDSGNGLPPVALKRGVDFGVIPGQSKPSLFKPGAEKIATQYGLCQRYEIVSKAEQFADPVFFHYVVRCDLVKLIDGREYVITSSFGSSNTLESRNGRNSAWNAANATLKMAQKRALTGAVLALCSGSSMFTQDIEDETFMKNAELITKADPEKPISKQQVTRLFAIAGDAGLTTAEAKNAVNEWGYQSTKVIPLKDYDEVCAKLTALGEEKRKKEGT